MAEVLPIVLGSEVTSPEDFQGEVERVVMDAAGEHATHVAVRPRHAGGPARLVPAAEFGRDDAGALTLRCTAAQFEEFPEDPQGLAR